MVRLLYINSIIKSHVLVVRIRKLALATESFNANLVLYHWAIEWFCFQAFLLSLISLLTYCTWILWLIPKPTVNYSCLFYWYNCHPYSPLRLFISDTSKCYITQSIERQSIWLSLPYKIVGLKIDLSWVMFIGILSIMKMKILPLQRNSSNENF